MYLLRAARISLNILVICVVPLLIGDDKYCIDLNIIAKGVHGVVSNKIRLPRVMLSSILPAGSGGGNPIELPSEGVYMNLLCMANKHGVSTKQVRTES